MRTTKVLRAFKCVNIKQIYCKNSFFTSTNTKENKISTNNFKINFQLINPKIQLRNSFSKNTKTTIKIKDEIIDDDEAELEEEFDNSINKIEILQSEISNEAKEKILETIKKSNLTFTFTEEMYEKEETSDLIRKYITWKIYNTPKFWLYWPEYFDFYVCLFF